MHLFSANPASGEARSADELEGQVGEATGLTDVMDLDEVLDRIAAM